MSLPSPVIVVPGITATELVDAYPLSPETIWSAVMNKDYERLALHPDDLRYEAREPSRVQAAEVFTIAYEELIEELRHDLCPRRDRPVPVYAFGYDWRQPLDAIEARLADFVAEVIDRTRLLRHYHRDGYGAAPRVDLVGHSMGGMVITGYLQRTGAAAPVGKVVTLATPYQGSYEAVLKVTTGTADLGAGAPSSRERDAARLTPALYHLLPSFPDCVQVPADLPDSLFDPALWQPSIVASITETIRLQGLPGGRRRQRARELLAGMLGQAHAHRERIDGFEPAAAGLGPDDWLAVLGAGATTRVGLKVVKHGGKPAFALGSGDRQNRWADEDVRARWLTGDGTVPLAGAVPPFLAANRLVCVTPDDYGYWEFKDRSLSSLSGFHGILPNMNMLHRLIVRFLTDATDPHGNTWGRRLPGVAPGDWNPPLRGLRDRSG